MPVRMTFNVPLIATGPELTVPVLPAGAPMFKVVPAPMLVPPVNVLVLVSVSEPEPPLLVEPPLSVLIKDHRAPMLFLERSYLGRIRIEIGLGPIGPDPDIRIAAM